MEKIFNVSNSVVENETQTAVDLVLETSAKRARAIGPCKERVNCCKISRKKKRLGGVRKAKRSQCSKGSCRNDDGPYERYQCI